MCMRLYQEDIHITHILYDKYNLTSTGSVEMYVGTFTKLDCILSKLTLAASSLISSTFFSKPRDLNKGFTTYDKTVDESRHIAYMRKIADMVVAVSVRYALTHTIISSPKDIY